MATGDTKTESYLRIAAEGERDDLPTDNCCNTKTQNLILGVANRIMNVEDEVEELKNNPDVVDVVGTYQDLEAYDTSTLTDKDIIRVLEDSTHDDKSTFYRWNASTSQFDYIGEAGGGGPNVVQTIGSSTTDVMSQDATSKLVFNGGSYPIAIRIGNENDTNAMDTISIGAFNTVRNNGSVSIGANAEVTGINSIGLGMNAVATENYSMALGANSSAGVGGNNVAIGYGAIADIRSGQVSFKKSSGYKNRSYNNTGYMLVAGVHDGLDAHDAVNLGQLDGRVKQNAGAPTTATVGTVGQLLEDTTNGKLYQCTAVDTTDPDNPSYTWDEVGGGGGVNVVQTTGSSQTDVMSQDATSKMVFQGGLHPTAIRIGNTNNSAYDNTISIGVGANQQVQGQGAIAIGQNAQARSSNCPVAIGDGAGASADNTVALGRNASAGASQAVAIGRNATTQGFSNSIALGSHATATRQGELAVGCTSSYNDGYNSTPYRVIGGVYDGQLDHDAVTVGQINALIDAINTATGSNIAHIGA